MLKRELLATAATVAIVLATPATAQTSSAPTTTPTGPLQNAPSTDAAEAAVAGQEGEVTDIVVVGSQIRGSQVTAALPVTVVDQAQIVNTGALSGDEVFRSIPQMGDVSFNSTYLPNSSNSARGDVGSVNLRNLGVGNTLVLLNGRRVVNHPTSRADDNLVPVLTYNTNTIPVFGIERLEILRDGAAAIYGSDAVAGVVNTVLQSNFDGIRGEAQVGFADGTNLLEANLNLLAGTNLGGGRGNITLYASYDKRQMQRAAEEPYTASADKTPLFANTSYAGLTALDNRVVISPFGAFQTFNNTAVRAGTAANSPLVTNASGQFHIQPITNGGCSATIPNSALCIDDGTNAGVGDRNLRFDPQAAFNTSVIPEVERANFFLTGNYELTEGLEFFGEAGYYAANTTSIQSSSGSLASAGLVVVPASNYYNPFGPVGSPNRLAGLNTPAAGLGVALSSYAFADVGPNLVEVENTQYRLLGGLRFSFAGLSWESAGMYSESKVVDTSDGISQTLLQRQLALSTPDAYNPFNGGSLTQPSGADGVPSNAAAIAAIRVKSVRASKATLLYGDLKGSTSALFSLPGGDVGMAIGGEIRRETQNDDRDARVDGTIGFTDAVSGIVNVSDLTGTSPSPDTSGRRTVAAAYLEFAVPVISPEMNVPLIRNLELQIAGRFEHYSDVGSVAKPKIAGAWDLVRGVRLRGSYAQGFKAPNLEQINARVVQRSNVRQDPIRCEAGLRQPPTIPGPTPGSPVTNPLYIASFGACAQSFATTAQRSGNPDLKPETSDTWSAGIVLEPRFLDDTIGRVVFTADYWNVKQKGIVGLFGEGNALINDYLLRVGGQTDPNVIRSAPTADDVALFAGSGLTPAGRVLFVKDQYFNLLPQEAAGLDLGMDWRLPDFGAGRFSFSANAAYLDKFFLTPSPPIQALIDARAAGTINAGTLIADAGDLVRNNGKPKWKVTGSATWEYREFQIGGFTSYTGDVLDTGLVNAAGVPWVIDDLMTFNFYAQVSIGDKRQGRHRLRIGVRNLTDESPPLSSNGYLGSLYNPYGRYWYANFRSSF